MRRKRHNRRGTARGQVALEYTLAAVMVAATGLSLWIFYQGFVQGNLYGGGNGKQNDFFGLRQDNKSLGLERVVSLPFP